MRIWLSLILVLISNTLVISIGYASGCDSNPALAWSQAKRQIFRCGLNDESPLFCGSSDENPNCEKLDISGQMKKVKKALNGSNSALNENQIRIVATFLELMDWDKQIVRGKDRFYLQTGPYRQLQLGAKSTPCVFEIMQTAQLLQENFSEFSFYLDGRIRSCEHLRQGMKEILAAKDKVKKNISRFHTPMHTIYFTNQTKFNHDDVGHMGLYINIEKENEIQKRLILFEVGESSIVHERENMHMGGFSKKALTR